MMAGKGMADTCNRDALRPRQSVFGLWLRSRRDPAKRMPFEGCSRADVTGFAPQHDAGAAVVGQPQRQAGASVCSGLDQLHSRGVALIVELGPLVDLSYAV